MAEFELPKTLVLVGLMGAGKSHIGRKLAAHLDIPFADADVEIEKAAGCSIADIFAQHGEAAFREGERKVIARMMTGRPMVIASGGGAFMSEETRALIAEKAISLWLRATVDVLMKRTMGRDHRPLLRTSNPQAVLQRLIDERYPVYALADITIDTLDQPASITVEKVKAALVDHVGKDKEEDI